MHRLAADAVAAAAALEPPPDWRDSEEGVAWAEALDAVDVAVAERRGLDALNAPAARRGAGVHRAAGGRPPHVQLALPCRCQNICHSDMQVRFATGGGCSPHPCTPCSSDRTGPC